MYYNKGRHLWLGGSPASPRVQSGDYGGVWDKGVRVQRAGHGGGELGPGARTLVTPFLEGGRLCLPVAVVGPCTTAAL